MTVRALIVDDEPLARRKLIDLIAEIPWAESIGEASDGAEALDKVRHLRPDVIFLDIQMPELSGMQVVERLRGFQPLPAIVFTTAYDQHAVAAFELEAVDYLLKPFGQARFVTALERAHDVVSRRDTAAALERARAVLAEAAGDRLDRIFVRQGNAVIPLDLTGVDRVEAQDDYVMIHAERQHYLVSLRIRDLEERLPNPPFMRVHRSHIVNLDRVERLEGLDDTRFEVRMKDGACVPVSRIRSKEIRRRSR